MSQKLPRITPLDLVRALKRAGWQEVRQTGSHLHLTYPDRTGEVLTVAMHVGRVVPLGTLKAILSQADLTAEELRRLL